MSNVKFEELRIGNWVNVEGTTHYDKALLRGDIVEYLSGVFETYGVELKPIPLTEDWLIRFGCIEQRISSTKKNYWNKELDFSVDVEFTFVNDELLFFYLVHNQERRKPLRYVHQLQNLHFTLKDVELTLTDKVE